MHGQRDAVIPDRPARAWAADLVEAWIAGQPTAPIVGRIPPGRVELAQAMARLTCERLRFYARRAATEGIGVVPAPKGSLVLRQQVERLLARQKTQRSEG